MPFPIRSGRAVVAAAGAAALVLALPAAAEARPRPVHKTFTAHGLVLRHTSSSVTLLASTAKTGKHRRTNTTVTVTLPSRRTAAGRSLAKRLAKSHLGDGITVTGTSTGSQITAKNFSVSPAPFHAYLGTITAIKDSMVTLAKAGNPSDDARENSRGSFTVDTSDANISLDGQPVGAAINLQVGETAAVLGSSVDDVVMATSVFAFSTAPGVVAGQVVTANGPLLTVVGRGLEQHVSTDGTPGEGDSQGDSQGENDGTDDGSNGTQVSLDSAALVVDGVSNAPLTSITVGARILALGTDNGNGMFNAAIAFVFTHGCSSRHHGDGGQDTED